MVIALTYPDPPGVLSNRMKSTVPSGSILMHPDISLRSTCNSMQRASMIAYKDENA